MDIFSFFNVKPPAILWPPPFFNMPNCEALIICFPISKPRIDLAEPLPILLSKDININEFDH